MFNVYASARDGTRLIVDLGVPYHEAIRRCEQEAEFLREQFHIYTARFGDSWLDCDGLWPRLDVYPVSCDPFALANAGVAWLPETE